MGAGGRDADLDRGVQIVLVSLRESKVLICVQKASQPLNFFNGFAFIRCLHGALACIFIELPTLKVCHLLCVEFVFNTGA
jgi:hypothetical protein